VGSGGSKYVLTAGELEVLRQAVRTADEVDRLEKAVRALPDLITTGSTGQPKAHPLLSEVRSHRQLLERLCGSLNLPDDDQAGRPSWFVAAFTEGHPWPLGRQPGTADKDAS
jgi:hypothetical protein